MDEQNVTIPLSLDWSTEEIVDVVNFYEAIDKAYKRGIERDLLFVLYRRFKEIVPSKAEEKSYFKEYEKQTAQSPFHVVKKAREMEENMIVKV